MSWIDKIKDQLVITCGDGRKFTPSWLNASQLVEYNVSEFEFANVPGTLVKRGTPLGRKFELDLYFQGDDHLEESDSFRISSNNPGPWTMEHPYYGILIVQPVSLFFDNSVLNVSKIKGLVIETITEDNPITTIAPADAIIIAKTNLDKTFLNVPVSPTSTDVNTLSLNNTRNFNLAIPVIKLPQEFEDYNNAFNLANSAVNNAIAVPLLAIRYTLALITKPALFTVDLKTRFNLLGQQFNNLRSNVSGLTSVSSKKIYQFSAGSLISSMCLATTSGSSESSAASIFDLMDLLIADYNQYIIDLDLLQSANGGNPINFIPDANSLIALNDLINTAISNLFLLALKSKKERTLITEKDTNIILLTHILYGLDALDANIDSLIADNNLGLNDLLQIKKGTRIVYYI